MPDRTPTTHTDPLTRGQALLTRWLGVGLAAALAAVTVVLAASGRIGLYINPDTAWFAVAFAIVALVGTVASFALPLGAESDHGHDHGSEAEAAAGESAGITDAGSDGRDVEYGGLDLDHDAVVAAGFGRTAATAATVAGGVLATGIVGAILVLPPASLSAELAMSRDTGAAPLFQGTDAVALATTGDTASFGVGEWATVFAGATNPDAFEGDPVTLTGFVTPGEDGFDLTRLVITHCVIDAQPASVPVTVGEPPETGQWVTVRGTVRADADGSLTIAATEVTPIEEPEDPYEY
ncbi:TIGR03943 family putative permease subunit [Microbacterium sp. zg.Y1084]|uniref:TIGR03943 family putative permease subunit n=1 Tax=Microbacterium sp. zg.Y1084 TaxID=2969667 RepID=UPI00214AB244|nr:TIGR03943 family protein [Microbacterium sp. zg.Y1084]MCR2813959.1 TIGR03943 family protein [Microbacterium sp. zg.Y1084]